MSRQLSYEHTSATRDADNYNAWVVDIFRSHFGRRVLEVGLGHGAYRRFFPETAFYAGLDINDSVIADAKAENPSDTYIIGDIANPDLIVPLRELSFDTVVCFNVLEHVEDHAAGLRNLSAALVPGGKILLFVPALPALYTDMDRRAGHHRRYTMADLRKLADEAGVEIIEPKYFNPVGGLGWWANKFVQHDNLDSGSLNTQTALFDKFLVPFSRMLNPLTKQFFGQSLSCVVKPTVNRGVV